VKKLETTASRTVYKAPTRNSPTNSPKAKKERFYKGQRVQSENDDSNEDEEDDDEDWFTQQRNASKQRMKGAYDKEVRELLQKTPASVEREW